MNRSLKIISAAGGAHAIQVIEDGKLLWQTVLSKEGEPIHFCKFYTDDKFAVMDWNGKLWLCDVSRRKVIWAHDFEGGVSCGAVLTGDKEKLYVAAGRRPKILYILNLEPLDIETEIEIPYPSETKKILSRPEGPGRLFLSAIRQACGRMRTRHSPGEHRIKEMGTIPNDRAESHEFRPAASRTQLQTRLRHPPLLRRRNQAKSRGTALCSESGGI